MATLYPCCSYSELQELLAVTREVRSTWKGSPLSRRDQRTFHQALGLGAALACDLSKEYSVFAGKRHLSYWLRTVARIDVGSLANFLSDAISLWRDLSDPSLRDNIPTLAAFKGELVRQGHRSCLPFLSLIGPAIQEFLDAPNGNTFYPVYQFLCFLNHTTLSDIDCDFQIEQEYVQFEEHLRTRRLPSPLIERMRAWMASYLKDFDPSVGTCVKHGPGSVHELKGDTSLFSKYRHLAADVETLDTLSYYTAIDVRDFVRESATTPRTNTLVLVAKSLKTKRTISKEPAVLQLLQQIVNATLRDFISRSHLSSHVNFDDQSISALLTLDASRSRKYATIDLSNASDSISIDFIESVFQDTTLLPLLLATRSTSIVLPSRKEIELQKYAPMGSALCFPIMTLVLCCVVECTLDYIHATSGPIDRTYRVYGDDIIVPDAAYDDVVFSLLQAGFTVNTGKSYHGEARFRESCGMHGYDGVDVTPAMVPRKFSGERVSHKSPDVFSGLCDLANTAESYGLRRVRRLTLDRLLRSSVTPFFSHDANRGILSTHASNFHTSRRMRTPQGFDPFWWYAEARCTVVEGRPTYDIRPRPEEFCPKCGSPLTEMADEWETTRWVHYWLTVLYGKSNEDLSLPFPHREISADIGSRQVRTKERWIPLM